MGFFDPVTDLFGGGDVPQFDVQGAIDKQIKYNRHGVGNVFGTSGWEDGTATQTLSPELQNLFNQQFSPGGYQDYAQNYYDQQAGIMGESYAKQDERLRGTMANRGLPVGGQAFDDEMANFMTAERNAYAGLAGEADRVANQRMMQDYQRLMGAMGQIPVSGSQIDVMGPMGMGYQGELQQSAQDSAAIGNLWDLGATVGAGYLMGPAGAAGVGGSGLDFFGNPV